VPRARGRRTTDALASLCFVIDGRRSCAAHLIERREASEKAGRGAEARRSKEAGEEEPGELGGARERAGCAGKAAPRAGTGS